MTGSPTRNEVSTPGPIASTTPAASIPGTYGFGRPSSRAEVAPERNPVSVGLTAAAWTRMRTSPGPGIGSGMSWTRENLGPSEFGQTDCSHNASFQEVPAARRRSRTQITLRIMVRSYRDRRR